MSEGAKLSEQSAKIARELGGPLDINPDIIEIAGIAARALSPGTTYSLTEADRQMDEQSFEALFPDDTVDTSFLKSLESIGIWEKVDGGHWKLIEWNPAPIATLKAVVDRLKHQSDTREGQRKHWPWQEVVIENSYDQLTPELNAYFQIIKDHYKGRLFTLRQFQQLEIAGKPTRHTVTDPVILILKDAGFLTRREKDDKYMYCVATKYLIKQP